jgi:fructose-bisphosphate aldolase class 1
MTEEKAQRTTVFLYAEDRAVIDALKEQHSRNGIRMNTSEAIRYALMIALPATNRRKESDPS